MTVRESWRTGLRAELRADRLLPAVIAGVLLGFIEVIVAISLGSLVFSGDLALYLPRGIGIALITSVVSMLVIALRTSAPGILGSIQDTPVVLMAVIGGTLVGSMAADDPALLPTVLVAIASISILTGGFLWALGMFNLGKLTRYIPYPVIGGFLAATGWLLAQGSIGTMAGYELTLDTLPDLLKSDQLILWGPGVAFGLTLFFGLRYITHDLTLPGLLVGAFLVFFAVLLITGTSIDEATDKGLLLGDSGSAASWKLLAPSDWIDADWSAILGQSANIGAILALSAVGLLLNASGLELLFKQDMDLNRELRAAGLANVLTGAAGGMVGYPTLSLTRLSHRVGGRGRLPGIAAAGVCAVMLFAGTSILAYFPVMILGGLLLFLGLDFLDEWAIRGYRKFNRLDYGVVLLILGVIATTDFLTGVGVGLVVMVILFVLQYTRIDVVRHALTGAEIHSNMERSAHHRRALAEMGDHVYMLELQGYIFFGTANALLERVRARLDDPDLLPLRFLVLDFRRVSGLDSSSVLSFGKIRLLADQRDFVLVLTHLAPAMQRQFDRDGLAASSDDGTRVVIQPDLDRGLEWCEDTLLDEANITDVLVPLTLAGQLAEQGMDEASIPALLTYLERVEVPAGAWLFRQGEDAADLYFIEVGQVSVLLELESGERSRLRTVTSGTVIGEIGFFLGTPRTASVIADVDTTAYRLSRAALDRIQAQDPALSAALNAFMLCLMAGRLVSTTRLLGALSR